MAGSLIDSLPAVPWHRESYEWFLNEGLPELLASRLPLGHYRVEQAETGSLRIVVRVGTGDEVEVAFEPIPQMDGHGLLDWSGCQRVIVPLASEVDLEVADLACAGEQLLEHVSARLGQAPEDLPWDEALVRAWAPLDTWIGEFVRETGQPLDTTNWLSAETHLRRIRIVDTDGQLHPSHLGRVCPLETPEGPNIGRIASVARGAAIRGRRLVGGDEAGSSWLGRTASTIPCLVHDDPTRALMGCNMLRQWVTPPTFEPALVRTGLEPDEPSAWCGRNLLTAYVSWGGDTFEDSIVLSESCAQRFSYPREVEPGDKLANRHGAKGTVSRILPDAEMPHLPDGTPVELVYSSIALHTRLNFGQVLEAVLGRVAHATGRTVVSPPLEAVSPAGLRDRLRDAGLDEDGQAQLTQGADGPPLERRSTVGWVYWGRLVHMTAEKIHTSVEPARAQRQGEMEYFALRELGAFEIIAENLNTRSAEREDAGSLIERVAAGPVAQAAPPTPRFADIARRLAAAGIRVSLEEDKVTFGLDASDEDAMALMAPVRHPWLPEVCLERVGTVSATREFAAVKEANAKLARLAQGNAPASLVAAARGELQTAVRRHLRDLLEPSHLRMGSQVLFSARSVLAVGPDLRFDQIGLPDEIAWALFGPLVERDSGGAAPMARDSDEAHELLVRAMDRSWVILNRAPTVALTALLAFRPVWVLGRALRIHPLACCALNADFDGDQAAVLLPITEGGQREARELLSLAGHLRRDPGLVSEFGPPQEAVWGLAELSRTPGGRAQIESALGGPLAIEGDLLTAGDVAAALARELEANGAESCLATSERLMHLGFEVAKRSGASLSPFPGQEQDEAGLPSTSAPGAWQEASDIAFERLSARSDYDAPDLGPQLVSVRSRARGMVRQLNMLAGCRGVIEAEGHGTHIVRGSFSTGLPVESYMALTAGSRDGLLRTMRMFSETIGGRRAPAQRMSQSVNAGYELRAEHQPKGFGVFARAMRSRRPGTVFALAASMGEVDLLRDIDARLLVGLPPLE